jgi:hypothetical protein
LRCNLAYSPWAARNAARCGSAINKRDEAGVAWRSSTRGYLEVISEENQRLIETAKGLWSLEGQISPGYAGHLKAYVNRLLDISERISRALARSR